LLKLGNEFNIRKTKLVHNCDSWICNTIETTKVQEGSLK
jgi:hypothetical protein